MTTDAAPRVADPGGVERSDRAGTVHAAGAVLWRRRDAAVEVAVVHRPHHRDWSLPKGKVDPGENRAETAVREIAEETGFAATLGRHLTTVRYPVGRDRKVVDYWSAAAGAGSFTPGGETDELRWLSPGAAAEILTYDADRGVLGTFTAQPTALVTVLLVRHAKAGRRAEWDGPDTGRPLVADGRAQAERLVGLLGTFGVGALYAVDNARCRETLAPAAAAWDLDVGVEAVFADAAVGADPGAARRRLLELARCGPVAAVCAQGDGIPALVSTSAAAAGPGRRVTSNRRLADPPCRKGSVWVLTLGADDGTLVAADYYRDATF